VELIFMRRFLLPWLAQSTPGSRCSQRPGAGCHVARNSVHTSNIATTEARDECRKSWLFARAAGPVRSRSRDSRASPPAVASVQISPTRKLWLSFAAARTPLWCRSSHCAPAPAGIVTTGAPAGVCEAVR
jgi:hypothetical protein